MVPVEVKDIRKAGIAGDAIVVDQSGWEYYLPRQAALNVPLADISVGAILEVTVNKDLSHPGDQPRFFHCSEFSQLQVAAAQATVTEGEE